MHLPPLIRQRGLRANAEPEALATAEQLRAARLSQAYEACMHLPPLIRQRGLRAIAEPEALATAEELCAARLSQAYEACMHLPPLMWQRGLEVAMMYAPPPIGCAARRRESS